MRGFLLICLGITGLWDGFTTLYGTLAILGADTAQMFISVVMAVVIMGLLFSTRSIMKTDPVSLLGVLLRLLWLTAVSYDLYTSYIGNEEFIIQGIANDQQAVVLLGITILVSGSPIMFSLLQDRYL